MIPSRSLRLALAALATAAGLSAGPAAGQAAPLAIRRLALVTGANDGGPERLRLRYAISDAERFARVLQQMGGVAGQDLVLLLDPDAAGLRAAMADLKRRVGRAAAEARTEVILYYSGHSDEDGLLLRGDRIPYGELRAWLEGTGAGVRIGILDSCASGNFTRGKGGIRTTPFLVDASTQVSGQVILTSSSADEASQESDRIGASFFTHYLVTGLRGAADASRDGKVTLSEVYQFAFHETLARTERTRSGPQHPAWDIALVGAGDVVMTDLRGTGATLVLPAQVVGRFFVRDAGERLVAELRKEAGEPVSLALDPGSYRVTRETDGLLVEARLSLGSGATELPRQGFEPVPRERTAMRGDQVEDLARIPVDVSIFPPVSLNGDRYVENRLQLGLIASRTTRLRGLGLAPVLWADEDVIGAQLAYIGNSARGKVTGVQGATVANVSGPLSGLQVATGLNLARGPVQGMQLATFASWATDHLHGAQAAVFLDYAHQLTGIQAATIAIAEQVQGGQLGLVNMADDVQGAQVGLVNVALRARGTQVGLVNLAGELDGAPVGLVSLAGNGEQKVLLLGDESGMLGAAALLGSQTFHTLLVGSVQQAGDGPRIWAGLGLGTHAARGRLLLDVDLVAQAAQGVSQENVLVTARALVGWSLRPPGTWGAALVAGPTVNGFFAEEGFDPGLGSPLSWRFGGGDGTARGWLGFQVGLRAGR